MRAVFGGVFKCPFVAGDEAIFEAILPFEVRDYVGGEAAKGADFKNRGGALWRDIRKFTSSPMS